MGSYSSVYYQAFTELYPDLVNSLKSEYTDLTDRLFSQRLISDNIREEVLSRTTNRTETERTRTLLSAVQNEIYKNPANYHKFHKILSQTESAVYRDVAALLEKKVQEIQTQARQRKVVLAAGKRSFVHCSCTCALTACLVLIGLYFFSSWDGLVKPAEPENDEMQVPLDNGHSEPGAVDMYTKTKEISHNLPQSSSPFFGREHNIEYLTKSILKHNRIININGPPAFGKSSLAIKIGWTLIENYSATFKEVRYIDTETTKSSIYLCSKRNDNSLSQKFGSSKSVITLNDTDSPHQSDTEPNVCEWSKHRPHKTLLILDNCDFVLRTKRQDFVNLLKDQFDRCGNIKNNLSIIITSQEKLFFLDDCFESFSIAELDPTDSASMLNHYVPNIDSEMAHNFSSLVGHCPLALKVIGRLLAPRGAENAGSLLHTLRNKTVVTISNKITDNKERFKVIMDLAYTNLDIDSQECSLIVSLFPSTFESTIGSNILSNIVNRDCFEELAQKSITEEYYIADKTRYTMHTLVRSYFTEIHGRDPFCQRNLEDFESNFISSYTNYLLRMLKDRHKFKNVTEEEVHRVFYLEDLNLKYFSELLMSRSSGKNITNENMLAFSFLIFENILGEVEKELAFPYYFPMSKSRLYFELYQSSSHDVSSKFLGKLLVVGIKRCNLSSEFHPGQVYWQVLFGGVPMCDMFSCNTLSVFTLETLSTLVQEMEEGTTDRFILSIFKDIVFSCQSKRKIIFLLVIFFIFGVVAIFFIWLTVQWFKRVCHFNFKTLSKLHFLIVCCIVNLPLDLTFPSSQLVIFKEKTLYYIYFFPIALLFVTKMFISLFVVRNFCFIHPKNVLIMFLSNVFLTIYVQILFIFNNEWYPFYTHLLVSVLTSFLMFKKRITTESSRSVIIICVIVLVFSTFLTLFMHHFVADYIQPALLQVRDSEPDLATY